MDLHNYIPDGDNEHEKELFEYLKHFDRFARSSGYQGMRRDLELILRERSQWVMADDNEWDRYNFAYAVMWTDVLLEIILEDSIDTWYVVDSFEKTVFKPSVAERQEALNRISLQWDDPGNQEFNYSSPGLVRFKYTPTSPTSVEKILPHGHPTRPSREAEWILLGGFYIDMKITLEINPLPGILPPRESALGYNTMIWHIIGRKLWLIWEPSSENYRRIRERSVSYSNVDLAWCLYNLTGLKVSSLIYCN